MELKLKNSAPIKVIYEGQEYFLKKPSLGQALALEQAMETAREENTSVTQVLIEFLVGQGLPKEVLLSLDAEMLEILVEGMMPKKKS